MPLAVLITPARFEIRDNHLFYSELRERTILELANNNIAVIDPIADFKTAGFKQTHFKHDGHWSPLGHEIAGKAVAQWLTGQGLDATRR